MNWLRCKIAMNVDKLSIAREATNCCKNSSGQQALSRVASFRSVNLRTFLDVIQICFILQLFRLYLSKMNLIVSVIPCRCFRL